VVPLLALADGVVMVARAGRTRREVASSTARLLERYGPHETGVVLNEAREFSIPLAKRGMYRPSRKVRKTAEDGQQHQRDRAWTSMPDVPARGAEPPRVVEEPPVAVEPDEIVQIPDVQPQSSDRVEDRAPSARGSASDELRALRHELTAFRAELDEAAIELPEIPTAAKPSTPIGFRPGSDRRA
jgi:hypothetical protein